MPKHARAHYKLGLLLQYLGRSSEAESSLLNTHNLEPDNMDYFYALADHYLTCQGTVPEAIIAFLDSQSYEDAIRNAVLLGGDSDTLACITGGIAEAFYGSVPSHIRTKVKEFLTPDLWAITENFCKKYGLE